MSLPFDGRFGLHGAYNGPQTQRNPDSNCLQHAKSHKPFCPVRAVVPERQDGLCMRACG